MIKSKLATFLFFGVFFISSAFIKNGTETDQMQKFVVVLDAGHGGHDPGNLGNGYLEKNIALAIVLEAGRLLERQDDVTVIYTRKDDTFIDLYKRGKIANDAKANLFVSVHCDSHNSDAFGAGTFVLGLHANKQNFEVAKKENSVIYLEDNYADNYAQYDINSPESVIGRTIMQEEYLESSIELAKLMQQNFTKKLTRKDRKVKQAGFIVLHQTFMPSVLVETGFLTNKTEGAYLNSKKGQKEMATAMVNAILSFKDGVDANVIAFDTPTPEPEEVVQKPKETVEAPKEQVEKTVETPKDQVEEKVGETETATKPDSVKPDTKEPEEVTVPKPKIRVKSTIGYKIQLMASGKEVPLRPENFNGLSIISKEPYKNLFRYMYGNATSYQGAKKLKEFADSKGYTSSYIVAYRDGVRIPLAEAIKSEASQ
ncbi:N-acetylmuramoyl-L-alanine amidase [Flagellimonas sp. DF-77]|uniref:N-acetylmuramoyl-L-alanine amidase family protein n=1 Tax=Flagellimonas algarum TaxID=3230298 RepID=UPI003395AB58